MADILSPENPALRRALYPVFRRFLSAAERKRRWVIEEDVPWEKVNRNSDPVVATVIESFCAVELFLPDYVSKAMPLIRTNQAWSWFHLNWGYEESKHSLALQDWLLKSGMRTEEQLEDLQASLFVHDWNLPQDSAAGMLIYAMVQELATWVHYRNLRNYISTQEDPALHKLLTLVTLDECAHHGYYRRITQLFLTLDRSGTIELLHQVLSNFSMPAVDLLADSRQRRADIRALKIFDEDVFYEEVYQPLMEVLGITRKEMRNNRSTKKSAPAAVVLA